jgi:hypothetical protein
MQMTKKWHEDDWWIQSLPSKFQVLSHWVIWDIRVQGLEEPIKCLMLPAAFNQISATKGVHSMSSVDFYEKYERMIKKIFLWPLFHQRKKSKKYKGNLKLPCQKRELPHGSLGRGRSFTKLCPENLTCKTIPETAKKVAAPQ